MALLENRLFAPQQGGRSLAAVGAMKICYMDAFSGISGAMTIGALLDAGADFGALSDGLGQLGTGAQFRVEKTRRVAISASKFHVEGGEAKAHRHLHHILAMIDKTSL